MTRSGRSSLATSLATLACGTVLAFTPACSPSSTATSSTSEGLGGPLPAAASLADVEDAIVASGATWTAGTTSVSVLPLSVRKGMLGVPRSSLHPDPIQVAQGNPQATPFAATLPAQQDWRSSNGSDFVSPVLDQGQCGSCVAFATVGTFETQLNITADDPLSPWELSPAYLFSCGGGDCAEGMEPDQAAQFVATYGLPDDACMPYTSGANDVDQDCSSACADAQQRSIQATGTTTPTYGAMDETAIKTALLEGPLVTTMTVYDDFFYYTGGVYTHVTGDLDGGHAVSIVGWSDADQAWIARNSWGVGWGMSGFFEIAYADISGVGQDTWAFQVAAPGPYVALVGIRDASVLAGAAETIGFDGRSLGSAQVTWTMSNGTSQVAQGASASGTSATIDTTKVPDGVYSLLPHAALSRGVIDGAARRGSSTS